MRSTLILLMLFALLGLADPTPASELESAVIEVGGLIEFENDDPSKPVAIDLYNGNNPLKGKGGRNEAVTDAWLAEHLVDLPTLRKLSVSNCAVTNAGMIVVGKLIGLEELNLTLTAVSDDGLRQLGKLTELRTLGLASSQCTGTGFDALGELKKLESVNLHFTPVSDAGLAAISQVPVSGRFWFAHTKFTDEGAKVLAAMKDLKICGIGSSHPESSGAAVAALTKIPLVDLSLLDKQADPEGFEHASRIHTLRKFDAGHAPTVDDASLAKLATLPELVELRIGGASKITDAGILALKDAKALQQLTLQRLKGITDDGVTALQEARPDLTIVVK